MCPAPTKVRNRTEVSTRLLLDLQKNASASRLQNGGVGVRDLSCGTPTIVNHKAAKQRALMNGIGKSKPDLIRGYFELTARISKLKWRCGGSIRGSVG